MFGIGKLVLVFQTWMGKMLEKLWFWWTGLYKITQEFKGLYQLGTVLKPYDGLMPSNPFKQPDAGAETDSGNWRTGNQEKPSTDPVLPATMDKD